MAFPDLPFDPKLHSFNSHEVIRDYLEQYAERFGLKQYIKVRDWLNWSIDFVGWLIRYRGQNTTFTCSQKVLLIKAVNQYENFLFLFQFETIVESVKPSTNGDPKSKWEVSVRDLNNIKSGLMTHIFDAVFVCNG